MASSRHHKRFFLLDKSKTCCRQRLACVCTIRRESTKKECDKISPLQYQACTVVVVLGWFTRYTTPGLSYEREGAMVVDGMEKTSGDYDNIHVQTERTNLGSLGTHSIWLSLPNKMLGSKAIARRERGLCCPLLRRTCVSLAQEVRQHRGVLCPLFPRA